MTSCVAQRPLRRHVPMPLLVENQALGGRSLRLLIVVAVEVLHCAVKLRWSSVVIVSGRLRGHLLRGSNVEQLEGA